MTTPTFVYLPDRDCTVNLAQVAAITHGHIIGPERVGARLLLTDGSHLTIEGPRDLAILAGMHGAETPLPDAARTEVARALDEARRAVRGAGFLLDEARGEAPAGADCLRDALAHIIAAVATLAFPEDAEGAR